MVIPGVCLAVFIVITMVARSRDWIKNVFDYGNSYQCAVALSATVLYAFTKDAVQSIFTLTKTWQGFCSITHSPVYLDGYSVASCQSWAYISSSDS